MEVLIAPNAGFCFGVERAIELALAAAKENKSIYSQGEIIHNRQVVAQLEAAGVKVIGDLGQIPPQGTLLIRSHGLPPQQKQSAEAQGLKIIDATCPFVKRAQDFAQQLTQEGYQVIIVGDSGHPEVTAIVGATDNTALVVARPEELTDVALGRKVGIVAQTTQSQANLEACVGAVLARAQELKIFNTICTTTSARQANAVALAGQVECMIVIGGRHSANTTRLAQACAATGVRTYHIEDPEEMQAHWFKGVKRVGVTAGASTPNWMIEGVVRKMTEIAMEKETMQGQELAMNEASVQPNEGEAEVTQASEPAPPAGIPPAEPTQLEANVEPTPEQTRMEVDEIPVINRGDVITGKVIQVSDDEVMVDIGYKSEGVIPKSELAFRPVSSAKEYVKVGDEIKVYVERLEDQEGNPVLSKRKADAQMAWERLERAKETGEIIEAPVVERVKGGLLVDVGVRGFVPASQATREFVNNLEQFIGQVWQLKVMEVDRKRSNVVLSRRALLDEAFKANKEKVYSELEVGAIREGEVKRITDFGAFVDIGHGVEGLLHVSELSYSRVRHPRDVIKEGDKLKVMILGMDAEKERISLGYKQTQPDPWKDIATKYPVGAIVEGTVTRLVDFGAFVQLEEGVEGLVHISQLSDRHVAKANEVVTTGERVMVKVLSVDEEKRRIGLSIREAMPKEKPAQPEAKPEPEANGANVTLGDIFGDLLEQANTASEAEEATPAAAEKEAADAQQEAQTAPDAEPGEQEA